VKEFILLNTPIKEILLDSIKINFTEEMKFNNHITYISSSQNPETDIYLERNIDLESILNHFEHLKISQVSVFDFHFHFQ
jgi:hypothetical protein